jgi:hypothetical protein
MPHSEMWLGSSAKLIEQLLSDRCAYGAWSLGSVEYFEFSITGLRLQAGRRAPKRVQLFFQPRFC